jgi:hypothetical protein
VGGHPHLPIGEGVGVPAAAGGGQPRPARLPSRAGYDDETDLDGPLARQQRGNGPLVCVSADGGEHLGRLGVSRRAKPSQFDRAADIGQ